MDLTKLTRTSHRHTRPSLTLLDRFPLAAARAHELCGTGRRRLALWAAQAGSGTVLWLRAGWHPDRLHMAGVPEEIAPGRLVFVEVDRPLDILWSMEEALRAGIVPLVIADLQEPPGLTPVRRLHLAAEAGAEATGRAPLGLLLTPGTGGAPGVESRWQLEPAHSAHATAWRLARLRARDGAPGAWDIARGTTGLPEVRPAATVEPA